MMIFNPELSNQAQGTIFSQRVQKKHYPALYFHCSSVKGTCRQNHLAMLLVLKLDFHWHWKTLFKKLNKTVALLHKFQNILLRSALLPICKCFVRTYLDYGDAIYDQAFNISFHQKVESLQYKAALAITSIIKGTSREKIINS